MSGRWAVLGAVIATLAAGGTPAFAVVVDQGRYSGADAFSFDDCGFTLDVAETFSGSYRVRADRGGQAFYAKDTFSHRSVFTNPDTDRWFVVRGHGVFNEIKATHVEGNIYEFVAVESGQPVVIEDSAGRVVVRDRGTIVHTALFDTFGDGQPGGKFLEASAVVHGPHPAFDDDFPFCEIAATLTGA